MLKKKWNARHFSSGDMCRLFTSIFTFIDHIAFQSVLIIYFKTLNLSTSGRKLKIAYLQCQSLRCQLINNLQCYFKVNRLLSTKYSCFKFPFSLGKILKINNIYFIHFEVHISVIYIETGSYAFIYFETAVEGNLFRKL